VRTLALIVVSVIFASIMTAPISFAAPSCCDQGKSTNGTDAVSVSPQSLRAVPSAREQFNTAQQRPTGTPMATPQARWIVPAAAVTAGQVVPGGAPQGPACCQQPKQGYVSPQAGCCGPVPAQASPPQRGCCGQMAPSEAGPQRGCCGQMAPGNVSPQRGCCGQVQQCPGCAGPQVRPAPGNCCPPAMGSSSFAPGATSLPAAMPIADASYVGPTRVGQMNQAVHLIGTNVNRPMNPTRKAGAPSYAPYEPKSLW